MQHPSQTALLFDVALSFNLFQGYYIWIMTESIALRIVTHFQLNVRCVYLNICLQQSFFLGEPPTLCLSWTLTFSASVFDSVFRGHYMKVQVMNNAVFSWKDFAH